MGAITISKVRYYISVQRKTATITRADGAWAKVHDNENDVEDWDDEIAEMIANNDIHFSKEDL